MERRKLLDRSVGRDLFLVFPSFDVQLEFLSCDDPLGVTASDILFDFPGSTFAYSCHFVHSVSVISFYRESAGLGCRAGT